MTESNQPTLGDDGGEELKDLLVEAIELPPSERSAFLEARCAGRPQLRAAVEQLIAAHERAGQFLAGPTVEPAPNAAATAPPPDPAPRQIGPYKLLQPIGEGGFGTVYLAEQEHPVRRRVALKIIKLGMDTQQVIARFEAERQALAMMDHPNIAKVFDAGATEAGRPYFVMELVNGVPVTEYCDANRLTPRQRLELFVPICHAVQHAHTKGIIHRDIKPSNVLVTLHDGRPVPKVIDFGIAKATQARLTEKTYFTEFRQMIGTPQYMSPEQAEMSGLDIDTRSDVYSLGVLLYELLTGATPFDPRELRSKAYAEIQRVIREIDPPRPSTKLSTSLDTLAAVAARRGVEPAKLSRLVRGDLDWIVMKCLEKDRTRRYETAASLSEDVQRYLDNEGVRAAPPTYRYRAAKFIRRNRGAVTAVAAVLAVLVVGLVVSLRLFVLERRSSQRAQEAEAAALRERDAAIAARNAEAEARAYEKETDRFLRGMFEAIDPAQARGKEVLVREILDQASQRVEDDPPKYPTAEASVRFIFGVAYLRLGLYEQAQRQLEKALELERRARGGDSAAAAHVMDELAQVLMERGKPDDAEQMSREALEIHRKVSGPDHRDAINAQGNLGMVLINQNKLDEADALLTDVLARDLRTGASAEDVLTVRNNLANVKNSRGQYPQAEAQLRTALDEARKTYGNDHPNTLAMMNNLGDALRTQGKFADAEALGKECLDAAMRVFGPDHPTTVRFAQNQALRLQAAGKLDESAALFAQVIPKLKQTMGEDHPRTLLARSNAALVLQGQGKTDEALAEFRDVSARMHRVNGPDDPNTFIADNQIAWTLVKKAQYTEAEKLFRDLLPRANRIFGENHPAIASTLMRLGHCLLEQQRAADAEPILAQAYHAAVSAGLAPAQAGYASAYGLCLARVGKPREALPPLLEAQQALSRQPTPDAAATSARVIDALVDSYEKLGEREQAELWRKQRAGRSMNDE